MKLNWFLMKLYNIKVYFNKLKKKRFSPSILLSWRNCGACSCVAKYIASRTFSTQVCPGARQLQQLQQCSRPASTPGISLIILGPQHSPREQEEGSSVSKQFIGAPGLGVYGEPQACLEEPLEKMGRWYVDGPIRILSVRQPLISSGPLVFAAPTIVCLFFSQNIMWY